MYAENTFDCSNVSLKLQHAHKNHKTKHALSIKKMQSKSPSIPDDTVRRSPRGNKSQNNSAPNPPNDKSSNVKRTLTNSSDYSTTRREESSEKKVPLFHGPPPMPFKPFATENDDGEQPADSGSQRELKRKEMHPGGNSSADASLSSERSPINPPKSRGSLACQLSRNQDSSTDDSPSSKKADTFLVSSPKSKKPKIADTSPKRGGKKVKALSLSSKRKKTNNIDSQLQGLSQQEPVIPPGTGKKVSTKKKRVSKPKKSGTRRSRIPYLVLKPVSKKTGGKNFNVVCAGFQLGTAWTAKKCTFPLKLTKDEYNLFKTLVPLQKVIYIRFYNLYVLSAWL
jgi:hypothetical protein